MRIKEDIPILGTVTVNFLELSTKIFNIYIDRGEIERQKNTPHLGLISHAFRTSNHSRYDYLVLQSAISEIIENTFKGTINAQGSITIDGRNYNGNDIIKSWILLSNFGHCKNTIGDEKTLLLYCVQKKSFKNQLLRVIKDDQLREWSKKVLERYDYINFHHILSFYRIYKCLKRRVAIRNEIITVYKLSLLSEDCSKTIANPIQITQLKTIYNIIRDIAVIALDSRNSSLPISLDLLGTILSIDSYEKRYQNSKVSIFLEPLYSILCDHLYLNIKSQTHQRSYEVNASKNNIFEFPIIIDKAIDKGLDDPTVCTLEHFLRIKLHSKNMMFEDMSHATRDVLRIKKGLDDVEASMDINPFTDERVVDFYYNDEFKNKNLPLFIHNISQVFWRQIKGTATTEFNKTKAITTIIDTKLDDFNLNDQQKDDFRNPIRNLINANITKALIQKNIPAFKELLWSVLKYHIEKKFHFDIDHHVSNKYDYFAVKIPNYHSLNNLDLAINAEDNEDRKHELLQIKKSANRTFEGTVIICLSRIKIYNYSLSPDKRIVTDIDGVVLKFNENELILELHESKNTQHPVRDAVEDLKNKLVKTLNENSNGFKIRTVKGFGAKIYIRHINNNA
jgi:hypothetical protein